MVSTSMSLSPKVPRLSRLQLSQTAHGQSCLIVLNFSWFPASENDPSGFACSSSRISMRSANPGPQCLQFIADMSDTSSELCSNNEYTGMCMVVQHRTEHQPHSHRGCREFRS